MLARSSTQTTSSVWQKSILKKNKSRLWKRLWRSTNSFVWSLLAWTGVEKSSRSKICRCLGRLPLTPILVNFKRWLILQLIMLWLTTPMCCPTPSTTPWFELSKRDKRHHYTGLAYHQPGLSSVVAPSAPSAVAGTEVTSPPSMAGVSKDQSTPMRSDPMTSRKWVQLNTDLSTSGMSGSVFQNS